MSGLTMGLLSLDLMTLKIMKDAGTPKERKQAAKILPIVERHHLLLVTLLLANAAAVESMPIFLDRVSTPIIAILVSVTAVLIFGEVIPQAVCTRFGLAIGAALCPIVYLLIGLFFIVSWPLSKLLDCILGTEHGTFFRRVHLKALVDLHGPASTANLENGGDPQTEESLTIDEVLIIKGALDMKNKTVKNAMLPLSDVSMLNVDTILDWKSIQSILTLAHSRIPIYKEERTNIIAVLIVKRLICLDVNDGVPLKTLLNSNSVASVINIDDDMPLYDLLNLFQTGKGHLAVVKKSGNKDSAVVDNTSLEDIPQVDEYSDVPEGQVIGIITLEDVIEELIQEEIIDETDVYVDIHKRIQVARAQKARRSHNHFLRSKSQPAMKDNNPKVLRHISSSLPDDHIETTDENAALISKVTFQ